MSAIPLIALVHAGAGMLALATFWTAAALRKGSSRHRLTGRVYLLAMVAILATGVPLTAGHWMDGRPVAAAFLGYLLLLVGTTVWLSWRAIRDRTSSQRYFGRVHATLAVANTTAGLGVLALGVSNGIALLAGFSLVGVFTGVDMWRRRRVMPARPGWWMQEHYAAMVGNGAATHVAFLALGLPRLVPEVAGNAAYLAGWFAPVLLAVAANIWLDRRYAHGPRRATQTSPSSSQPSPVPRL